VSKNTIKWATTKDVVEALRQFAERQPSEYNRQVALETADRLWMMEKRRADAVRQARYVRHRVKVHKVKRAERPRLLAMIVDDGKMIPVDYNDIRADREYVTRKINEGLATQGIDLGETGECCVCGYKAHSQAVSKLPTCNDCGKARSCEYKPRLGAMTRINCHLWVKEAE